MDPHRRRAFLTLCAALGAFLMLVVSGFGYRGGVWALGTAFSLIKWAAYAGIAISILALTRLVLGRPTGRSLVLYLIAIMIAVPTAVIPARWKQRAGAVPPIHDITTDTQDPPAFVDVLPLRASAKNPTEYGGDSVAALQKAGYPDLAPLTLPVSPGVAFTRARQTAETMGWAMVAADSASGRIEATATTTWFGFEDDVVIRVTPSGAGSVIDVRSVSRLGGSDVGTNAARIRAYLARLSDRAAAG
ncbi:MAG TPA: DUF1499 domain-containing protein [Gemmatimonadaceae bacterium]|nr:DUF1499 domain-containing protein [Gemmatimonadaceae bacterium]